MHQGFTNAGTTACDSRSWFASVRNVLGSPGSAFSPSTYQTHKASNDISWILTCTPLFASSSWPLLWLRVVFFQYQFSKSNTVARSSSSQTATLDAHRITSGMVFLSYVVAWSAGPLSLHLHYEFWSHCSLAQGLHVTASQIIWPFNHLVKRCVYQGSELESGFLDHPAPEYSMALNTGLWFLRWYLRSLW